MAVQPIVSVQNCYICFFRFKFLNIHKDIIFYDMNFLFFIVLQLFIKL